jgi:hypothetical protein
MSRPVTRASLALLLIATLTQVACDGSGGTSNAAEAPKVAMTVSIEPAAIPSRYAAPLPNSVAGMQTWIRGAPTIAPVSHVIDSILNGNPEWLKRLTTAASSVPAAQTSAWAREWRELTEFHAVSAAFCTQARTIMSAPPGTLRVTLAGAFAKSCAKPGDIAAVVRADTPYWAVLKFYDPYEHDPGDDRPFDPRLVAAARDAILGDAAPDARAAAFVLANQHDSRAVAALLTIHAAMKDQSRADEVAMAFFESDNADGRQRAAAACRRKADDAMCGHEDAAEVDDEEKEEEERPAESDVKARIAQLAAAGFAKVSTLNAADIESDASELILTSAGHAYWFDVETDRYPNQHDSLMRNLAALVTPALDDAVFEERAPPIDDESAPYELSAYSGGKRYHTGAENLGDWYDVSAVLRLMNAVMADKKLPQRFAPLVSHDQTLTIIAATPEAMTKASGQKLLEIGDEREAERAGKQFEEQVLEKLERAGR